MNVAIIPEDKDSSSPDMTAKLVRDPVCAVLRKAREDAGYDIPDIAQLLRIQRPYLEAIEDGRYGDLPGTVYAIGFVRTYSDFLNLDTNDMVRRFKEEASELSKRTDYVFPVAPTEARVPGVGLLVIGVLLAALAYGAWFVASDGEDGLVDRVADIPDRFAELASRGGGSDADTSVPAPDADQAVSAAPPVESPAVAGAPVMPPDLDALASLAESRRAQNPDATAAADSQVSEPAVPEQVIPVQVVEETSPQPAVPADRAATPAATPEPIVTAEPDPPARGVEPIETVQSVESIQRVPPSSIQAPPSQQFEVAAADPQEPSSNGQPKAATTPSGEQQGAALSAPTNILPGRQQITAEPPPPPPAFQPDQPRRSSLGNLNSRIVIRATEMSWVQITDDLGNLVMTRVLDPGETYRVPNTEGLTLASGNAGGLEILVDGVVQPPLGLRGTVVRNVTLNPDSFGAN